MRRFQPALFGLLLISSFANAQLAVFKMVGKNSENSKMGFGTFAYWDFPLNEIGTNSLMIELLDFAYFPQKNSNINSPVAYVSIKAGFKYIFSEESKTGFYVEPSVGYCRVVYNLEGYDATYGDGVALAAEAGYSLEVGKRANTFVFGLKYETDMGAKDKKLSAIGLRIAYSFHMFRKRSND